MNCICMERKREGEEHWQRRRADDKTTNENSKIGKTGAMGSAKTQ